MILHELGTNAVKYGALSSTEGTLDLEWKLTSKDGEGWVQLSWLERNGPPVSKPGKRAFGTKLIERAVTRDLRGEVRQDFALAGFRCVLEFPLDQGETTIMEQAVRTARGVLTEPPD